MAHHDIKLRASAPLLTALAAMLTVLAPALPATSRAADDTEDERWFQVELIVFAQRGGDPENAEQWPEIIGTTLPADLLELSAAPEADTEPAAEAEPVPETEPVPTESAETAAVQQSPLPVAYEILTEDQWQLTDVEQRLRRATAFEPLLHLAWRQPTMARGSARPVLLYEGMTDPLPASAPSPEPGPGLPPETAPEPFTVARYASELDTLPGHFVGPPNPRFVGTVTVSVARYLHFNAELLYRSLVTQNSAVAIPDLELWYDRPYPTLYEPQGPAYRLEQWQAMRGFRMQESRRMRSRELHYLDHPFFGIVVLITPVELPEAVEEPSPTEPR